MAGGTPRAAPSGSASGAGRPDRGRRISLRRRRRCAAVVARGDEKAVGVPADDAASREDDPPVRRAKATGEGDRTAVCRARDRKNSSGGEGPDRRRCGADRRFAAGGRLGHVCLPGSSCWL